MQHTPNLDSFLKLGYFLSYDGSRWKIDMSQVDKTRYAAVPVQEIINLGKELFLKSIENSFDRSEEHLVPISGGLDSRAILGALLQFKNAGDIYTYTFGTPGTLDFEIGNHLAKVTGTRHTAYDLTTHQYGMDELLEVSRRIDHQCLLFCHPPIANVSHQFARHRHWSGFMGGTLTGEHIPAKPSFLLDDAKAYFLGKNTYVKSIDLSGDDNTGIFGLLDCQQLDPVSISYEEQLDFMNRQIKYIAPHVLMKGFNYATPFGDPLLTVFFLSQQGHLRENKFLYKKILSALFPELYSHPTKTHFGLSLESPAYRVMLNKKVYSLREKLGKKWKWFNNPMINYIDFRKRLENDPVFRKLFRDNIHDLYARKIIDRIDILSLWKDHTKGRKNHMDALLVLTSLEIHLKAGKKL